MGGIWKHVTAGVFAPLAWGTVTCMVLLGAGLQASWAAPSAGASVYTCIDSNGRRITSDRYIASCSNREQRELSPSGTLRRIIPPTLSGLQLAEQAARQRAAQAQAAQARARERALDSLFQRYPTQQVHEQMRQQEIDVVAKRLQAAKQQLELLRQEKDKAEAEMAFYKKNPAKAPAALRTQIQALLDSEQATVRYAAQQQEAIKAIHTKFDAEAAELMPLWKKK